MSNGTAGTTTWELKLKEYVSGGFKKLTEIATGTQKKINDVSGSLDKAAKASIVAGRDFKRSYSDQEKLLSDLEERMKRSYSTKDIERYKHAIADTTKELERMEKSMKPHKGFWGEAKEGLHESLSEVPGASGIMGLASNPIALGVAAVGGGLFEATKHAIEFEDGMAKINSTAQLGKEELEGLQEKLQSIGSESGGNFDKIPEAFNLIEKQTHNVDKSLEELKVSTKGAQAGFIDLNVASDATAKMASVLGKEYTNATDIMDEFFYIQKKGAGDLSQIMQELPHLTQLGMGVGLSFKETSGILAMFTKTGESAEQAGADMMGIFNTMRSADVIAKFKDAGIAMYDKQHHLRKFDEVMKSVSDRMKSIEPDMQMDFLKSIGVDDSRKAKGILMLTQHIGDLKQSLIDANHAAGSLENAYESSDNTARRWGNITDRWKDIATTFGREILPVVEKLEDGLEGWTNIFSGSTGRGINNLSDDTGISKAQAKKLSSYGFNSSQWMTNDTDVASGKRLLKYSEKLDEEVKKFSQLGDYAKNLEIVSLSKQEKTFANSPEGKAMANMVNEAIGKLANGKTPTDKATEAVNNGTSTNTTSTEESKSGATSDGTKVRSLTMNVHITNTFKAEDDNVLHKVKKQIGDALVDAARDGMTTIGV